MRRRRVMWSALLWTALFGAGLVQAQDQGAAEDDVGDDTTDSAVDAPTSGDAPACAPASFRAQLMTPLAGRVPRDAGVVVGLVPGGSLAALPPLSLTRRRRTQEVRVEPIAPGLFRVIPDARRVAGRWHLSGVEGDPELLFARARIPPAPARPALSRVERYVVASGGAARTEVKARFAFPIPPGVVAVLAYYGDATTPAIYGRAVPQRNEALLWSSSACLPDGATAPSTSGSIRVAFVDLHGQISELSEASAL